MKYIKLAVSLLLMAVSAFANSAALPEKSDGFVNDFAAKLSKEERAALNHTLAQFQEKSKVTIIILTFPSSKVYGYSGLVEMGVDVFDKWKPGDKNNNSGLLLLVSGKSPQYKIRIVTGRGVEGAVPDAIAKRIVEDTMKPVMHSNSPDAYVRGLTLGVQALMKATANEFTKPVNQQPKPDGPSISWILVGFVGIAFVCALGVLYYWVTYKMKPEPEPESPFEEEPPRRPESIHDSYLRRSAPYSRPVDRPRTRRPAEERRSSPLEEIVPIVTETRREEDDDSSSRLSFGSVSDDTSRDSDPSPKIGGETAGGGGGDDKDDDKDENS